MNKTKQTETPADKGEPVPVEIRDGAPNEQSDADDP